MKKEKAITLISLVITIVVLIILAGVAIYLSLGNNGIFEKTKQAKEATNKQTATEKINLKITTAQMNKYAEEERMPTLKELSLILKEDYEIQYVMKNSQVGSAEYDITSENPTSIFTKLKEYSYEFEINSSLQLASIDGIQSAKDNPNTNKNITFYVPDSGNKCEFPKGIKEAYVIFADSTNENPLKLNITGEIVENVEQITDNSYVHNYGNPDRQTLTVFKVTLNDEGGYVNFTTYGGSGSRRSWAVQVVY